jgi:hypothetical protein
VHISALRPEFPEYPHNVLVSPELHGVYAALLTPEQRLFYLIGGEEIHHFLIHRAANMGIPAKGISPYQKAGDINFTKSYCRKHISSLKIIL